MNTRNENDKRNYLAFIEYFGLVFYGLVLALIVCGLMFSHYILFRKVAFVQCSHKNTLKTKEKYKYVNATDWSKDSTISEEKKMYYESLID